MEQQRKKMKDHALEFASDLPCAHPHGLDLEAFAPSRVRSKHPLHSLLVSFVHIDAKLGRELSLDRHVVELFVLETQLGCAWC